MTISEAVNPTAVLTAPQPTTDNFGENLRWQAGPLLGGLDWLLEQLAGVSAIQSLVEPMVGDWTGMSKGQQAWAQAERAAAAVGQNFEAASRTSGWTGQAAEAYGERMLEIADSFEQYADGCSAMAEVTGALVELAKATAEGIVSILGFLGDWLSRILAQMAIPVFGWAVGVVDSAISSVEGIRKVRQGLRLIQTLVDAVERLRNIILVLNRLAYVVRALATTMTQVNRVRTVAAGQDATATAFGVQP